MIEMAEKSGVNEKDKEELLEDFARIRAVCGEMPPELTFKGVRRKVMERVWKRAESAEKQGEPFTSEDFSRLLTEEWAHVKTEIPKLKAAYQACRQLAMKEGSSKSLTKDQVEKRVEYFFEMKRKELLNDLGLKE